MIENALKTNDMIVQETSKKLVLNDSFNQYRILGNESQLDKAILTMFLTSGSENPWYLFNDIKFFSEDNDLYFQVYEPFENIRKMVDHEINYEVVVVNENNFASVTEENFNDFKSPIADDFITKVDNFKTLYNANEQKEINFISRFLMLKKRAKVNKLNILYKSLAALAGIYVIGHVFGFIIYHLIFTFDIPFYLPLIPLELGQLLTTAGLVLKVNELSIPTKLRKYFEYCAQKQVQKQSKKIINRFAKDKSIMLNEPVKERNLILPELPKTYLKEKIESKLETFNKNDNLSLENPQKNDTAISREHLDEIIDEAIKEMNKIEVEKAKVKVIK